MKFDGDEYGTSYIDLASIIRTGDTLTVLDMQDARPVPEIGKTAESYLFLVGYDCGNTPRSMILAALGFHGNMASGTPLDAPDVVPTEPPDGWHVMTASQSGMLKAREMACNALGQQRTEPIAQHMTPPVQSDALGIHAYCATHNAIACNLYVGKVGHCPEVAAIAASVLVYERKMEQQMGATPQQAYEQTFQTFAKNPTMPLALDDLNYIAAKGTSFPDTEQPAVFAGQMQKQCVAAAAE